jgi:protein involved in polysaccharide export with SLBB domain
MVIRIRVANDGRVELPFLNQRLRALGHSSTQFAAAVRDAFNARLKPPLAANDVSVQVWEGEPEACRTIEIRGAVRKPGVYRLSPELTLTQALEQAGGVVSEGDSRKVIITREVGGLMICPPPIRKVDLRKVRAGRAADPVLELGDLVLVGNAAKLAWE